MKNQSFKSWASYDMVAYEEDPFIFPNQQLRPLDSCEYYTPLNWQWEFPIQESMLDATPLMENFPTDPLMESFSTYQEDFHMGYEKGFAVCDEMNAIFEPGKEIVLHNVSDGKGGEELMKERGKRCKNEKKITTDELTWKTISCYFYLPITQAAKELNVGLTLLKKRCRELGISRWPHRKLMSLQTLIKNVQELGEEGEVTGANLRNAVEILEQERKLMEEVPDMQLEEKTKKLRQACFKANYKKRKLMEMEDMHSSSTTSHACMEAY